LVPQDQRTSHGSRAGRAPRRPRAGQDSACFLTEGNAPASFAEAKLGIFHRGCFRRRPPENVPKAQNRADSRFTRRNLHRPQEAVAPGCRNSSYAEGYPRRPGQGQPAARLFGLVAFPAFRRYAREVLSRPPVPAYPAGLSNPACPRALGARRAAPFGFMRSSSTAIGSSAVARVKGSACSAGTVATGRTGCP
jgi:hypothetical protein